MEIAEVPSMPLAAAAVMASRSWSEMRDDWDLVEGLPGGEGTEALLLEGGAEDGGDISCSTGHLLLLPVLVLVDRAGSNGAPSSLCCLAALARASHCPEESGRGGGELDLERSSDMVDGGKEGEVKSLGLAP